MIKLFGRAFAEVLLLACVSWGVLAAAVGALTGSPLWWPICNAAIGIGAAMAWTKWFGGRR